MYFSVLNSSNVECSKHTYFMIKIHIFKIPFAILESSLLSFLIMIKNIFF